MRELVSEINAVHLLYNSNKSLRLIDSAEMYFLKLTDFVEFDNTYSFLRSKHVWYHIELTETVC